MVFDSAEIKKYDTYLPTYLLPLKGNSTYYVIQQKCIVYFCFTKKHSFFSIVDKCVKIAKI